MMSPAGACAVGDVLKHGSDAVLAEDLTIGIRSPQSLKPSTDPTARCAIDSKLHPENEADFGNDLNRLKSSSSNS